MKEKDKNLKIDEDSNIYIENKAKNSIKKEKGKTMSDLEIITAFEMDSNWFLKNMSKLKREYKNKFVLVKDKKIVETAGSMDSLIRKAEREGIDVSTSVMEFVPSKEINLII